MEIKLKRLNKNYNLEATGTNGRTISIDAGPADGGDDLGVRPMQLLLMGLGGCASIDVISILKKQRQEVDEYDVQVTAEREKDKVPSLFTAIHVKFILTGKIEKEKLEHAIKLSLEKYCSVAKTLEKTASITYSYTINGKDNG